MAIQAKAAAAARPNVNPDDEAEYFRERIEHEAQMARIRQAMGTSQARFEKMGVNVKGVKKAIRLANVDDAQAQYRRDTETFVRLGIITVEPDGQGSFIQGLKVAMPGPTAVKGIALARAHADGYNVGLQGSPHFSCTFEAGTEEAQKWRQGWDDGIRDRRLRNPDSDKVTQPAGRKPRGERASDAKPAAAAAAAGPATVSTGAKPKGRGGKKGAAAAPKDDIGPAAGNA